MRRFIVLAVLSTLLIPMVGLGDCGKIVIPVCPPTTVANPPGGDQSQTGEIPPEEQGTGEVPAPGEGDLSEVAEQVTSLGGKYFKEEEQQAVIGWNGKEQVMILTTNEQSLIGTRAMLSVLPLPGAPLSITRADTEAFARAKRLIVNKLNLGKGTSLGVVYETRIGAHNIFVWKIENTSQFIARVKAYISKKYNTRATALITPDMERIIESYMERGFRYFAFDLITVSKKMSTKVAIRYHFRSQFVYYPLVISKLGGTGKTFIDLVVFTPGELNRLSGVARSDIRVLGDRSVPVSWQELAAIDARMARLFSKSGTIMGRNFMIPGKTVDGFSNDLMARYVK